MKRLHAPRRRWSGFTLVEVLVTAVIIAFGLLSLSALQAKMVMLQMEGYQRAHALVLAEDMAARINSQRLSAKAGDYASSGSPAVLGTGDNYSDCTALTDIPARDLCEWSLALKGAGTTEDVDGEVSFLGAMIDARGCLEHIRSSPEAFRVSVVWQGLSDTVAPSAALSCGRDQYGSELRRRVLAITVTLANLN
ncbi:type IV pilus modification protein PilV [Thiocapsa roseopersicina]|uniref:Type IV pilus assembly protein PilV n=1 Tax=Thiocapsa roseopersicina TaxID=1058 RepID=A0A1H2Z4D3_THIRO|nr:type IV pilus modification protein PilV [Thiocapsa roseopersicina]SDX11868.1 type IV pilus assembly protein PilV [Thiocapsa roseopersicina]